MMFFIEKRNLNTKINDILLIKITIEAEELKETTSSFLSVSP